MRRRHPAARWTARFGTLAAAAAAACSNHPGTADSQGRMQDRVHVWLTTADLQNHLTPQPDVVLGSAGGAADVSMDDTVSRQVLDGFGAAFTDTSAMLIQKALSASDRAKVLADLFSRPSGIGLSLMRVPIGSSDFTACSCPYSYDDGAADPTLSRFSTAHDDAYVIPVIEQAQAINPQMKLFANTWSAPAWMKTNASMLGVDNGALRSDAFDPFAQYLVRFLQDYRAKGISIWAITPQNEPTIAPSSYSAMLLPGDAEATFIADNLAPAMEAGGVADVEILAGDDVSPNLDFANALFANPAAASAIHATGWHCYSSLEQIGAIHDAHPEKPVYMTECSTGPTGIAGDAASQTLVALSHWASGAVLWNLALDQSGGPKMGVGCEGCTGLVTIDESTGQPTYTINYYELAQFSKFIVPGAARVATTDGGGVWAVGALNPDGSDVLVAYNPTDAARTFEVGWNGRGTFAYTLASHATVTFTSSRAGVGP
jgi:glucosylceramidase